MTKADLVDIVAGKTGLTKRDVAQVVEALLEAIKASLAQHKHIEIREFGTFKVKRRKASMKYNPRDRSQKVVVPEKMVPVFKPSKFLKERVNWSGQESAPGVIPEPGFEAVAEPEASVSLNRLCPMAMRPPGLMKVLSWIWPTCVVLELPGCSTLMKPS